MKKIIVVLLSLIFAVFIFNCESTTEPKEESSKPFECKVDGEKWVPDAPNNEVTAALAYGYLVITATRIEGTTGEQLTLFLGGAAADTTINLGYVVGGSYATFTRTAGTSSETFMTDAEHTGTVEITKLDSDKKKVEGTFSLTAKSVSSDNTVQVTNGSFSLTYTAI
jgi:hypothetical protein